MKVGEGHLENREELKRDRNEPGGAGPWEKRYRYCVLYTQVLKQWEVYEVIRKALPEGGGRYSIPVWSCGGTTPWIR